MGGNSVVIAMMCHDSLCRLGSVPITQRFGPLGVCMIVIIRLKDCPSGT